jgi:uncharacterized membrane protein YuzA (DUF378 family)
MKINKNILKINKILINIFLFIFIYYKKMDNLILAIQLVLIVAALNWGLVAYNGTDLVKLILNKLKFDQYERHVKLAIGAVAVYAAYQLSQKLK